MFINIGPYGWVVLTPYCLQSLSSLMAASIPEHFLKTTFIYWRRGIQVHWGHGVHVEARGQLARASSLLCESLN